ncbi:TrkH family potassium uptake protein [Saliphagus sp. LR7]|uniref:TrkH family potassium uptake protein n=1 Tax=Saliphagus sp. LR7 TaxID=2282654 RepID=UPI000DF813CC|nr:TrkH family potassium uptake protein [Saliphagus sp. LR7]
MSIKVDWKQSLALTGTVLKYLALPLCIPLVVSILYREGILPFILTIVITVGAGAALEQLRQEEDFHPREALLFVALAWGAVCLIGAIPYLIAGYGTNSTLAHPANALFESTSGITTTGATVMGNISTEQHSHALLMWRQLTQWLGGMGIIVLMVAILPQVAVNGAQLIQSEAPGPELQQLTPQIAETARLLWMFYFGFTILYICILLILHWIGLAPNMGVYNAVAHGFTTLPTGGFSPEAASIAAFSPAVQWVVIPFMIIAGVNFALWYYVLQRDYRSFIENREFQVYLGAIAGLILILWGLLFTGAAPALELGGTTQGNLENSARQAAFQIGSLMNSTGFATSDFAQWDATAQAVLLFAMFIGGSAGSTGGGIKVIRWVVVLKTVHRELYTTAHPDAVRPIRLGGYIVDEDVLRGIIGFTFMYLLLFGVATVVIVLDAGRAGLDLSILEALSASLATIGNIGPGFGILGPFGSYLEFPVSTKLIMVFLMWAGRLEIIPVLVLFTGPFWKQ